MSSRLILPPDLELESSLYTSLILTSITCGFYFGLVFTIIRILMKNRKRLPSATRNFYLIFEGVASLLSISAFACMIMTGQEAWIIHREDPETLDGPLAYLYSLNFGFEVYPGTTLWYPALNYLTIKVSMFMGDALLIYRCHRIFGAHPFMVASLAVFSIAYLGLSIFESIMLGIAPMITTIIMLFINPIITVMISIKISSTARRMRGNAQANSSCTNTSAILTESAVPWTVTGIFVWLGFMFSNYQWWSGTYIVWMAIGLLSPQLIILRIAMGIAWDENTSHELRLSQLVTMTFASNPSATNLNIQGLERPDELQPSAVEDGGSSNINSARGSQAVIDSGHWQSAC